MLSALEQPKRAQALARGGAGKGVALAADDRGTEVFAVGPRVQAGKSQGIGVIGALSPVYPRADMQADGIRKARGIEVGNGAVAGGDLKDEDDPGLDMVLGGNLCRSGQAAVMDAVRGDIKLEMRVAGNGLIHGEMSAPAKRAGRRTRDNYLMGALRALFLAVSCMRRARI